MVFALFVILSWTGSGAAAFREKYCVNIYRETVPCISLFANTINEYNIPAGIDRRRHGDVTGTPALPQDFLYIRTCGMEKAHTVLL
ncbi:MAG: hypothetical protein JXA20_02820 [Spirochaetes bacterium]|nr:hypothetical protein [Spirochaetota bacterium]